MLIRMTTRFTFSESLEIKIFKFPKSAGLLFVSEWGEAECLQVADYGPGILVLVASIQFGTASW